MQAKIKRYLIWFLIYTISYGLGLAVLEYLGLNEINVWKLVFRSLFWGSLMALFTVLRHSRKDASDKKKNEEIRKK